MAFVMNIEPYSKGICYRIRYADSMRTLAIIYNDEAMALFFLEAANTKMDLIRSGLDGRVKDKLDEIKRYNEQQNNSQ